MTCDRPIWGDADGLACGEPAGHPGPHVYVSTSVTDAHDRSEQAAEARQG